MTLVAIPGDAGLTDADTAVKRSRGRPRKTQDASAASTPAIATTEREAVPMRPEMRPEMRDEDPRAAAERRANEILGHLGDMDEGTDEFYIPKSLIPDGWCYEWKRRTVYGKEDTTHMLGLRRTGWEPVPTTRHPDMMPTGGNYPIIERKGMMLMERPQQITDRVVGIDRQRARDQVRAKEAQLGAAPTDQFSRTEDPRTRPNIKKSYEAIPIPQDK